MERLKCDRCGQIVDDKATIELAKKRKKAWRRACKANGVEPRGLCPCPHIGCSGELRVVMYD